MAQLKGLGLFNVPIEEEIKGKGQYGEGNREGKRTAKL